MANKWMTADEWRATKGAERAEARKRPVRVATEVV